MNILRLLDELEQELMDKKGLFSKKIDVERCADILYEMKEVVPQSLREADYIVANKQKILDNADSVARNTIREAEERAEHIIDNSELIKRAEIEGRKIVETAYMQCDALVERTKSHLDNMFKDIEQFLLSTLAMIRNNREELRGAMIMNPNKTNE